MRSYFFILLFIVGCNSAETETIETTVDTVATTQTYSPEKLYIWSVDSDSMTIIKNPAVKPEFYNVDSMIKGLNFQYPEIQLKKVNHSNDTIFLKIDDAEYLTQRLGSTGPEFYMANVFFNLTSVPGIDYVHLDFKEGDHARPGILTMEDYKQYKQK